MTGHEPRTSIWSIPESRRTLYFGLFTVLTLAGTGWIFWYEIAYHTEDNWAETVQAILRSIPAVGVSAAIATVAAIESERLAMVVGDWLEEKIRKNREKALEQARQEGREEGRSENREQQAKQARRLVESGQLPAEVLELLFPDGNEARA